MNCKFCKDTIHPLRLKALPNTRTCVKCSTTEKVGCHVVITGKNTYSELEIMDSESAKKFYHLQSRKSFGVSNGVKFRFDSRKN